MNQDKKTRAAVPPPRKKGFLPSTVEVGASNNMKGDRIAPMTFNMPRDWHTEFKTTAVVHGVSMKDLLTECFDAWKREQKGK
jgi:hypothetical protein